MSRKRCHRRVIVPMPPRGLRPKLDGSQLLDLSLAHVGNLDTIARGDAGVDVLWQYVGGVLTWSKLAELLQLGVPEMTVQLHAAHRLIERWKRTGQVRFDGPDYQLARDGVQIMDELAAAVDRPTAVLAAEWGERHLNALQSTATAKETA